MFALKTEDTQVSGDRRVDCSYCGKVFRSHNYLKMHEKWHKGELEHICTVCNRAFRFPSELKKHISIHSGELPYKCDQCGKCFARVGAMHEHMWTDHQQNMASVKIERRGIYNRHHNRPPISRTRPPLKREATRQIYEPTFENDLFRNISLSEISFRESSMMSEWNGISIDIPDLHYLDPNRDRDNNLEPGSYEEESILGLNQEFHQVRNMRFANQQKSPEEEQFQDDWQEESSLPTGWKSNSEGHYMSPSGQTFGSRRAAQEFLSRQEATIQSPNDKNETTKAPMIEIETHEAPIDGGCQNCLLIQEYEKKIAELEHSHN